MMQEAGSVAIEPAFSRRNFIKGAAGLLIASPWMAQFATAAQLNSVVPGRGPAIPKWPEPNQTRQIWLNRKDTGETVVARYFENGRIRMNDYHVCCKILRDVRAGVVVNIDIELLDLIFAMQNWLVSWGIDKPIVVTSGYRTPRTNASLEGAARNSLHMQGRAMDLRMPGVPMEYVGRLASIFAVGGVGFYTGSNFTHIDTGNVRYWRG